MTDQWGGDTPAPTQSFEQRMEELDAQLDAKTRVEMLQRMNADRLTHESWRAFMIVLFIAYLIAMGIVFKVITQDNAFRHDCINKGYSYGNTGGCSP